MSFPHLVLHTHYSVDDSVIRLEDLVEVARLQNISALAMTDSHNVFGLLKFEKACRSGGVKPIFGVDLKLYDEQLEADDDSRGCRFVVLAQDTVGFANLRKLISLPYRESFGFGLVKREHLESHNEGLIMLSGGKDGDVGRLLQKGQIDEARSRISRYQKIFGDRYYVEVRRTGRVGEDKYIESVVSIADDLSIPLIATNDVCMLHSNQFESLQARLAIAKSKDIVAGTHYSGEQYLRSADEMQTLFKDLPDAVANACEVAKRCNVRFERPEKPFVPKLETLQRSTNDDLTDKVREELERYLSEHEDELIYSADEYRERLERELSIIIEMEYSDYFLIVHEIIDWARQRDIPLGPGRGSGAGSLVALMLRITELDPLEHELYFERFLNPERTSMPDFDIDVCGERRGEVIDHIVDVFGKEKVGLIVTFNSMAARSVIHDAGRHYGVPFPVRQEIAECIPVLNKIPLRVHLKENEELQNAISEDAVYQDMMNLALDLEGLVRSLGKHPAGIVIAPGPIDEYVPIFAESSDGVAIAQLDKDDVEEVGMVKFDFLGLKTLTVMDHALEQINHDRGEDDKLTVDTIPLGDKKTFELLQKAHTEGVFQLESMGMQETIKRLLPDRLEDLCVLNALYRPGPMENGAIDVYIQRKNNPSTVMYWHPTLEPVLNKTYGEMVYQEDVMNVSKALAGFTLGKADNLRRAMGKKDMDKMLEMKSAFLDGAEENDVSKQTAMEIYDRIERFAGYGFPRAHAMSYALITYRTAYLKAHHFKEYMSAYMSTEFDGPNSKNMPALYQEARRVKVNLLAPNVNRSQPLFCAEGDNIRFGLATIKGVGNYAAASIVAERKMRDYTDLFDFCQRLDLDRVTNKALEHLVNAGALDEFGDPDAAVNVRRPWLYKNCELALQSRKESQSQKEAGQGGLFAEEEEIEPISMDSIEPIPWDKLTKAEEDLMAYTFSVGTMDSFAAECEEISERSLSELEPTEGRQSVRLAGKIAGVQRVRMRSGDHFVRSTLQHDSSSCDVAFFDKDNIAEIESKLRDMEYAVINCQVTEGNGNRMQVRGTKLLSLEEAREIQRASLTLSLDQRDLSKLPQINDLVRRFTGKRQIYIETESNGQRFRLKTGTKWKVEISDELLKNLGDMLDPQAIRVEYPRATH